jgi:hypothetical protein
LCDVANLVVVAGGLVVIAGGLVVIVPGPTRNGQYRDA